MSILDIAVLVGFPMLALFFIACGIEDAIKARDDRNA